MTTEITQTLNQLTLASEKEEDKAQVIVMEEETLQNTSNVKVMLGKMRETLRERGMEPRRTCFMPIAKKCHSHTLQSIADRLHKLGVPVECINVYDLKFFGAAAMDRLFMIISAIKETLRGEVTYDISMRIECPNHHVHCAQNLMTYILPTLVERDPRITFGAPVHVPQRAEFGPSQIAMDVRIERTRVFHYGYTTKCVDEQSFNFRA
jgi:hypothetical protein